MFNNHMAKRQTSKPRQYGRQAEGKTIKSLSLETDVAEWAEKEAEKRGMSFSAFVNDFLKGILKLLLFFAFCASLFRWAESGDPATGAMMGVADAATFAFKAAWFIGSAGVEVLAAFVRS